MEKPGGRLESSSPAPFSSFKPGQVLDRVEAEMLEELRRGAVGHRPARRAAAAAQFDPAGLQQHVDGALRGAHAPDLLDLGAGHRLVIGDDGERLERGARQAALLDGLLLQQEGQIVGGAERPFAGDAHQIDAAPGIDALQLLEQRAHVLAARRNAGAMAASSSGSAAANSSASTMRSFSRRSVDCKRDDIGGERQRQARSASLALGLRLPALLPPYSIASLSSLGPVVVVSIRTWSCGALAAADQKRRKGFRLANFQRALARHFQGRGEARGERGLSQLRARPGTRRSADRAAPNRHSCRAAARARRAPLSATTPCAACIRRLSTAVRWRCCE